jgi:ligand-binding sensor domain-containing protein
LVVDEVGDAWIGLGSAWVPTSESWTTTGVAVVTRDGAVSQIPLPPTLEGEGVHALARDDAAGLWVARHVTTKDVNSAVGWARTGTGVSRRDTAGRWIHFGPSYAAGLDDVRKIAIDGDGNALFATGRGLLSYSDSRGWSTVDTGSAATEFHTVAIDAGGGVWAGSDVGAHRRDESGNWTTWTEADGLSDHTVQAFEFDDRGRTWMGTGDGGITVMPKLDP